MMAGGLLVVAALTLLNLLIVLLLARRVRDLATRRLAPSQPRWLAPGSKVSAFEATTIGGEQVTLARLLGRPVLAGFFSTTCEPCLEQLPVFAEHAAAACDQESVLAVIIGHEVAALDFATMFDGTALVVREERRGPVAAAFSANALPGIYRLDPVGTVVASGPSVAAVTRGSRDAPSRR